MRATQGLADLTRTLCLEVLLDQGRWRLPESSIPDREVLPIRIVRIRHCCRTCLARSFSGAGTTDLTLARISRTPANQADVMALEGRRGYRVHFLERRSDQPLVALARKRLQRSGDRIDVPAVADAERGIDGQLVGPVEALVEGESTSHIQSGCGLDEGRSGSLGKPLAPPARDVGHDDVRAEMQSGSPMNRQPPGPPYRCRTLRRERRPIASRPGHVAVPAEDACAALQMQFRRRHGRVALRCRRRWRAWASVVPRDAPIVTLQHSTNGAAPRNAI